MNVYATEKTSPTLCVRNLWNIFKNLLGKYGNQSLICSICYKSYSNLNKRAVVNSAEEPSNLSRPLIFYRCVLERVRPHLREAHPRPDGDRRTDDAGFHLKVSLTLLFTCRIFIKSCLNYRSCKIQDCSLSRDMIEIICIDEFPLVKNENFSTLTPARFFTKRLSDLIWRVQLYQPSPVSPEKLGTKLSFS